MRTLALLSLGLLGCAQTDSNDVLTSGIYASIHATASGDGQTSVSTTLFVGNPINLNFVDVTGDDELVASHGSEDKTMIESELLNIVGYHATFPTDAEGEMFEVSFLRSVDGGAPSSTARLPAKFTVDPPATSASRAAALTLTWSPSATLDLMSWQAEGDCIELASGTIAGDTGMVTIAPDMLKKKMGDMVPDTCAVKVSIIRAKPGMLDRGYGEGGVIQGRQVRTVMLQSTP